MELDDLVHSVGNEHQGKFEVLLSKLQLEKEEHYRLSRERKSRLATLELELERSQNLREAFERRKTNHVMARRRLKELQKGLRDRWHSGMLSSEQVEKIFLRIQWALPYSPEAKRVCEHRMQTLRTHLPLIRAIRVDIRHHERVMKHVRALERYCLDPQEWNDRELRDLLLELNIQPPDKDVSLSAQHLHISETAASMKEAHDDLHHELVRTNVKLLEDIIKFEKEAGHFFMHKGREYKRVVLRRQKEGLRDGFDGKDGEEEGDFPGARPSGHRGLCSSKSLDVEGWVKRIENLFGIPEMMQELHTSRAFRNQ